MKRLDTPKRRFQFTLGEDPKVYFQEDIAGLPASSKERMTTVYNNWLEAEMSYEREWRNYELTNSDFLLLPDATYNGKHLGSLEGQDYLADIMHYRNQLRAYNLTTDSRPTRPDWFKN